MAQSVNHPTLGFGSGHDLVVHGFEPHVRLCPDSSEPGSYFRFSVSRSVSAQKSGQIRFAKREQIQTARCSALEARMTARLTQDGPLPA